MNRILVAALATLAAFAGFATLATASTSMGAPHRRCTPSQPKFLSLTSTSNVSCAKAQAINTYMMSHETLDGAFRWQGVTWSGNVYSRAHGYTYMVYRHNGQTIWLVYPAEAS